MNRDIRVWVALLAAASLMAAVLLVAGPSLVSHKFPAIGIPSSSGQRTSLQIPVGSPDVTSVPFTTDDTIPSPAIASPYTSLSPTISGPPSFTLIVTPVEARASPGETIRYTMTIEPKGGFHQQVALRLDVSALLLYRNSFDLGSVNPPYPQTFEYLFRVPSDIPRGVTVKGVLMAEGGGHREERVLILLVGR